jgi:hypothetical protein
MAMQKSLILPARSPTLFAGIAMEQFAVRETLINP